MPLTSQGLLGPGERALMAGPGSQAGAGKERPGAGWLDPGPPGRERGRRAAALPACHLAVPALGPPPPPTPVPG